MNMLQTKQCEATTASANANTDDYDTDMLLDLDCEGLDGVKVEWLPRQVSATLSKRPTFALSRGPAPSAPENIFSPQIPSATGEGDLWRKNVVKMVARL